MVSEQFRRQLRKEAEQWRQTSLIDDQIHGQLVERYQLNTIDTLARNRFVAILIGVGCILLGLGVITFVAANWQVWSRTSKVLLLMGIFIALNATGFYLWRHPTDEKRLQRLGQGLLLAGALCLGANMALMSQMFHQSGDIYVLYLLWGLGVVVMAYSLRLQSLGVLAWILMAIGYSRWWFVPWGWGPLAPNVSSAAGVVDLMLKGMAFAVVVIFVPLAYRCRSGVLFGLAAAAFPLVFTVSLNHLQRAIDLNSGEWLVLSVVLPSALLWAYDANLYRMLWRSMMTWRHPRPLIVPVVKDPFQGIASAVAVLNMSAVLYIFSFREIWKGWGDVKWFQLPLPTTVYLLIFVLLAVLSWVYLLGRRPSRQRRDLVINTGSFAGYLMVLTGITFAHGTITHLPTLAPIVINALMFILAIALIRDGLTLGRRRTTWGGLLLLTSGILSRTLEYDVDLLLKALVFVVCGIGVILFGLWLERRLSLENRTLVSPAVSE